jgi:hypothetical protein
VTFQIQAIFDSSFTSTEQTAINKAISDWQTLLAPNDFAIIPTGTEGLVYQPNPTVPGSPAPKPIPLPQINDLLIYFYKAILRTV